MAGFREYNDYDALGLAALVRAGEVHPSELLEACLERIDRLNPELGAVVFRIDELARKTTQSELPDGPFKGVPFLIKDLLANIKGLPTSMGSRFFAGEIADQDSELVRRWRAAGLVFAGKTNTPEFGLQPTTESSHLGPARNPWDTSRTTGGSSGGSASAVAAGIVPIASGGDGGGSIRIPASCCGVFGLKPSRGRTPAGPGASEHWRGLAVEHVLTRSVRDSAAMLDATHGPDLGALHHVPAPEGDFLSEVSKAPGRLRIALCTEPLLRGVLDPECRSAIEDSAKLLQELGHDVVEARPEFDADNFAEAFLTVVCAEVRNVIEAGARRLGRRARPRDFEATTWVVGLLGRTMRASDLSAALDYLQASSRRIARLFTDFDVLLSPTLAIPPPLLGTLQPQGAELRMLKIAGRLHAGKLLNLMGALPKSASKAFGFSPYTPIFNATGQPAMNVPLHWGQDGTPIGSHFVGRFADEATLFRLAGQLEQARPWADRRPPIAG